MKTICMKNDDGNYLYRLSQDLQGVLTSLGLWNIVQLALQK